MENRILYIWFDRKHRRFYIGFHWGTEDDKYICFLIGCAGLMREEEADFKRRILVDSNLYK